LKDTLINNLNFEWPLINENYNSSKISIVDTLINFKKINSFDLFGLIIEPDPNDTTTKRISFDDPFLHLKFTSKNKLSNYTDDQISYLYFVKKIVDYLEPITGDGNDRMDQIIDMFELEKILFQVCKRCYNLTQKDEFLIQVF
jgi:hypothetical protein